MVCLHSGVFTRLQYMAYFNAHTSRTHRFVQSLLDFKLALEEPIPVLRRQKRTRACRITHKGIYRELGIPNVRHRRFADPGVYLRRLLSLDYIIDHPHLEWLPTEEEKVLYCTGVGVPKDPDATADLYRSGRSRHPVLQPEAPHCRRTDQHVCLCRPRQRNLHRAPALGPGARACVECHAEPRHHDSCGCNRVNPDADTRARAVLEGWAREETRVQAGSPYEAAFERELDEISSALDTSDSEVLARFGGFQKAGLRYRELTGMLAKPAPHNIRIDTFQIWRSRRIYPGGVQLYEAPE